MRLVEGLIEEVGAGGGAALSLQGEAGIGKTRLVGEARERAEAAGLRVLAATAAELDSGFAYGLVRDLFDRPLRGLAEDDRRAVTAGPAALAAAFLEAGEAAPDPFAIRHSLHWLAVNLAQLGPLLLAVDDAQWADPASLEWLRYLAARLEGSGIGLLVAARTPSPDTAEVLAAVVAAAGAPVATPRPLGAEAVAAIVGDAFATEPSDEFAEACRVASGGNPLMLGELVDRLADEGIEPTVAALGQVGLTAPRELGRTTLGRAAALGDEAAATLKALAASGPGAEVGELAAIAALAPSAVAEALAALGRLGLVEWQGSFDLVHPTLRQAILAEATPRERADLHARAAAALIARGASVEAVAAHLLETDPAGDPRSIEVLREVARRAIGRGDPATALACLRRASAESPAPSDPGLRLELGRTMVACGQDGGAEVLRAAMAEAADAVAAAGLGLELGSALSALGRDAEAIAELTRAAEALAGTDRELELLIESTIHRAARNMTEPDPAALARIGHFHSARLTGAGPGERAMLVHLGGDLIMRGGDAEAGAELVLRAVRAGSVLDDRERMLRALAAGLLVYCDRLGAAIDVLDELLADAGAHGSPLGYVFAAGFRCYAFGQTGELRRALADGESAVEVAESHGIRIVLPIVFAAYMDALVKSGDAAAALAVAERFDALGQADKSSQALYLAVRASANLALGCRGPAIAELREAAAIMSRWGVDCPGLLQWRTPLATALRLDGDLETARRLASEDVELTRRFGARRTLGVALVGQAAVEPEPGLPLLEEAVEVLAASEARLEHARAVAALGSALRRANRRGEARSQLLEALDLAARCGSPPLEGTVREELAALGARPRRTLLSGPDALTPSEARVAALAAEGRTNRQIAQELFVTVKTVETHLSRVYSKLSIGSREQLAAALDDGVVSPAP